MFHSATHCNVFQVEFDSKVVEDLDKKVRLTGSRT